MSQHAIEQGRLLHVSASQIKRYLQCPAAWGFQYIDRLPEPPKFDVDGRATGTLYHQEHEAWFETGAEPTYPSLQRLVRDLRYPQRKPGQLIEHPRDYQLGIKAAGVAVKGRVDLLDLSSPGHPVIVDLKSLGNLQWALDEEALVRDTQLLIYARYVFTTSPLAQEITLIHGVASTTSPEYRVVVSEPIDRETLAPKYAEIERVVARMAEAAKCVSAIELEQREGPACRAFGGCPYRQHCPAYRSTNPEIIHAMDLDAKLAERAAQFAAINPPDAAAPVPVPKAQTPGVEQPAPAPAPVAAPPGLHLYVDCYPSKGAAIVVELDNLIELAAAPIRSQHGVADVRQIDFGKGTAALVAAFRSNPPQGHVVARTGGLSTLVLEVLRPMATTVVEG